MLNEPETSLYPGLLPALAELIGSVAERSQVIAVSHARQLLDPLAATPAQPGSS